MVNRYLIAAGLLLAAPSLAGADDQFQRASLKGLHAVRVVVSPLHQSFHEDGLTESVLMDAVVTRLREAGIELLSEEAFKKTPGLPVLNVMVQGYRNPQLNLYAFGVSLQLNQLVRLERTTSVTLLAPTWTSNVVVGLVGRKAVSSLHDRVAEAARQFLDAHAAVNPR